jgi:DNA segregation ATPase FtsK/SpoIIIE, S-DNA-T family
VVHAGRHLRHEHTGLILDPHTRLYIADFKAGKDWDAAAQVAHRFMSGDDTEHVLTLRDWLVELVSEVQGRYRRMRALDNDTCPESKITPTISRDPTLNMPITAVFIDEVQVPLENRTPLLVEGKKLPVGEYIGELLTCQVRGYATADLRTAADEHRADDQP